MEKNKKIQLLESLFRGFPIGAITLYEDQGGYYIIDGLQRINTLQQYFSSPSDIISFTEFYNKVSGDIDEYLKKNHCTSIKSKLKKCIKEWYEDLNELYVYEKVSRLYNRVKTISGAECLVQDIQIIEDLRDLLKNKIEIIHDEIALIIYKGDKEDLPDLFKNINTGSVALSQYEILQSVWINNYLDEKVIPNEYDAFMCELELIKDDYEISVLKEEGKFDIFKNIVGLNHRICCIEMANILFQFPAFRESSSKKKMQDKNIKYFENDSIGFEIYSTILCGSSNKIVKAIEEIFKNNENIEMIMKRRSCFVSKLNKIIYDAILEAIEYISHHQFEENFNVIESKYHSLYIIAGLIYSKYDINKENLTIESHEPNKEILAQCLDLKKHNEEKWFKDENRQMKFFNEKIGELLEKKHG